MFKVGDVAILTACKNPSENGTPVVVTKPLNMYFNPEHWVGEQLAYEVESMLSGEKLCPWPHQLRRPGDDDDVVYEVKATRQEGAE